MEEFYIDADGVRLHAKLARPQTSERSPLSILLHGLTGHMEERHIVAMAETMVASGVAVLRVELFGHGGSDGDFARHTLLKWVDETLCVLDLVRSWDWVEDVYLAGHSQGGYTAMLVCGLRPYDVSALVALSPALIIEQGARQGSMLRMTFDPDHIPDRVWRPSSDGGAGQWLGGDYFRVAQALHVDEAIARYPGPVLVVHGDQDQAVPVSCSVEAARGYRDARLVIIAGDDHCYHAHLDEATAAVAAFLTELRQGA